MSDRVKKGKRNVVFGVSCQLIILALGLLVPRVIVISYGSEVNGLLSTTTQLLSYLAIFEAGIASVMRNSLYSEIVSDNKTSISGIYTAGEKYYRKVSLYYGTCLIIASTIFAFAIRSEIPGITIFLVVMLSGLSSVITFNYLSSVKNLIEADGNYYFISILDLVIKVLNYAITIFSAIIGLHIVLIKILTLITTIINISIYRLYFKKKYGWINPNEKPRFEKFTQRKYYVVHQLASLLFSSTDITLLTFFANLTVVSVYTVYNMVISAISTLMNSISSSLVFALGQTFSEDKRKYQTLHDTFKCFYIQTNFIIISTCYFVFVPFVELYMKGADANYADNTVALLFCLISLLNSTRMVDNNLASIAFRMKETMSHVITEAAINLTVSLALIWPLKIYGVLLGTIAAILYRSIVAPLYTERKILHRKVINGFKHATVNWSIFLIIFLLRNYVISIKVNTYGELVLSTIIIGLSITALYMTINAVFFRNEYRYLITAVTKKTI